MTDSERDSEADRARFSEDLTHDEAAKPQMFDMAAKPQMFDISSDSDDQSDDSGCDSDAESEEPERLVGLGMFNSSSDLDDESDDSGSESDGESEVDEEEELRPVGSQPFDPAEFTRCIPEKRVFAPGLKRTLQILGGHSIGASPECR
eukprot:s4222_g8.t1